MRPLQCRQRPRRTRYETTGRLSYHAIVAEHAGHAERPPSERCSGTRATTTLRKLPTASAGQRTSAAWLIGQPVADERGGGQGTGRVPGVSPRRGAGGGTR